MDYYGYAVPEGPGPEPWNDYYSYLVLHRNFIGFPPNDDPEGNPAGAAKATAAHEFHHCVQFAYDADDMLWFMEADAVYMEDVVYDHVNDNYNYLYMFFNDPEAALSEYSYRMYACFVWPLYLAQKFDTSLMVSVWEGARYKSALDAMGDTLEQKYGWTQDSAFADFACWNYVTGSRNDGLHHDEAAEYPLILIANQFSSYPVATKLSTRNPAGYGASYIQFFPGTATGELRVTFDGVDTREWKAYIIKSTSMTAHEFESIELAPGTYDGWINVPEFENYYCVTLVAANVQELSGDGSFYYSAGIVQPHSLRTELLTDSATYAGETRLFDFKIVNTSPTGEVFQVSYWDDLEWIAPDTVERFIMPGDSTTVQVAVSPPDTASLGSQSELSFLAAVKDDPFVFELETVNGVVVPKRGDVNYDGKLNLTDVTILISYVYMGGTPEPYPLWTGDFNCVMPINLSDITGVIDFVYLGGNPSSCDPYEK
jgi:hypothetical protein